MNPYIKYTGLAFQLILFIFSGYYFGKMIANYFGSDPVIGSVVGILTMLVLGLFRIIKDVRKET